MGNSFNKICPYCNNKIGFKHSHTFKSILHCKACSNDFEDYSHPKYIAYVCTGYFQAFVVITILTGGKIFEPVPFTIFLLLTYISTHFINCSESIVINENSRKKLRTFLIYSSVIFGAMVLNILFAYLIQKIVGIKYISKIYGIINF